MPSGGEATVIAWIWARTVKCPSPACGCEMPLANSFVLSKKKGKEVWIVPSIDSANNRIRYTVEKGRAKGADTVTVTQNEIPTALNKPEDFFLALVEMDEEETHTVYLKKPFRESPDFAAKGVTYSLAELKAGAEICYQTSKGVLP